MLASVAATLLDFHWDPRGVGARLSPAGLEWHIPDDEPQHTQDWSDVLSYQRPDVVLGGPEPDDRSEAQCLTGSGKMALSTQAGQRIR